MKKLISSLLVIAIALFAYAIIAPEKMPVDRETRDMLLALQRTSSESLDIVKKVAYDVGDTADQITQIALNKATGNEESSGVLFASNSKATNGSGEAQETAVVKVSAAALPKEKININDLKAKPVVVPILSVTIHKNPNDSIDINKEIETAKARFAANQPAESNSTTKKIITTKTPAEQKKNMFIKGSSEINSETISSLQIDTANAIEIIGHSSNVGDVDANMKLSKKRAENVKELLVKQGVAQENISITYVGPRKLAANGITNSSTSNTSQDNGYIELVVK